MTDGGLDPVVRLESHGGLTSGVGLALDRELTAERGEDVYIAGGVLSIWVLTVQLYCSGSLR
jgi:hypothetical protein